MSYGNEAIAKAIYDKNNLAYHNWDHISQMLNQNPFNTFDASVAGLTTAIVWHDVVYVPGATDNEEKSADLYDILCKPNDRVRGLILCTKDHIVPDYLEDVEKTAFELIIDLDLYNLGGSWVSYSQVGGQIRKEFRKYDDEEFMKGRKAFLEKYLARNKIYLTPFFSLRETSARNNMERELYTIERFGRLIDYEN